jgi:hypothetical protein
MCGCALGIACWLPGCVAGAEPVSFRNDVMAVLSKAGCNQGTCHGNQNGKNGFRLSLRGQDPEFDFASLTRDTLGRRVNPQEPERSLVLEKATATVPHEGGRRFAVGSSEYRLLRDWIANGLPPDSHATPTVRALMVEPRERVLVAPDERVQLTVTAQFSDGGRRDVTRLAVYEPSNLLVAVGATGETQRQDFGEVSILVRYLDKQATVQLAFVPARPGFVWKDVPEANDVDHHVFTKLRTLRTLPAEHCSDSVFLRRVYLDTLGILPTVAETRAFLAANAPDKRARLIDELLERPEFADLWALKWSDLLRNEEKTLDPKGVRLFHQWLRQSIVDHKPLDQFARELIAGRGSTYSQPAANYYRALRDTYSRSETTAHVFLGIRLQCAKCHNHPFDQWTQTDYHSLAAFFARVDYKILENNRKDKFDKHEFDGEQIVFMQREGEVKNPRTGETLPPRFLGARGRALSDSADRLEALADWVTSPDNPFFARAQVNRIWYHLLGRGLVEPIDDFRLSNPPSNAPLLDALAADLVAHRFDFRHVVRTILNSRTYQLSEVPNDTNGDDETNFARSLIRPLPAEPLLDALSQVMEVPVTFPGKPLGTRAGQLPGVHTPRERGRRTSEGERFMKSFGKPERLLSCECERNNDTTLGQAFQLVTGELINGMLTEKNNRLGRLMAAGRSTREILEECYLAALCRPPAEQELKALVPYVEKAADRRTALEDVLWGLLNAKEFVLRR